MARFVAALCAVATTGAVTIYINNTEPRLDDTGAIMDAHDCTIHKFSADGPYYMHAVAYGPCMEPANYGCDQTSDHCGFQQNHTVLVWSSYNLSSGSWHFEGVAIAPSQRPPGTLYRPDATYNPNTQQYVLWWNYVHPNGTYAGYAAATAPTPVGPFTMQVALVNLTYMPAGDFHLFVDDDGTGYVIYGADYYNAIEQLTPDFLASTGRVSPRFEEYFVEAPMLFKRNGVYYALFDHCCCYCYQGSGIRVHTAPTPLGPWTAQSNPEDLACVPPAAMPPASAVASHWMSAALVGAEPTPGQGCLYNGSDTVSVTRSQQNFIASVNSTTAGMQYIWIGDRWQQSWDGTKGHDPQFWYPLQFNADGSIAPVVWQDVISFEVD